MVRDLNIMHKTLNCNLSKIITHFFIKEYIPSIYYLVFFYHTVCATLLVRLLLLFSNHFSLRWNMLLEKIFLIYNYI